MFVLEVILKMGIVGDLDRQFALSNNSIMSLIEFINILFG